VSSSLVTLELTTIPLQFSAAGCLIKWAFYLWKAWRTQLSLVFTSVLKKQGTTIKSMLIFQGRDHIHLLRKVVCLFVCLFNWFGLLCHVEINHGAPCHALGTIGKALEE